MSDDDDGGGGGKKKKLAAIEAEGKKPITLPVWAVVAIALAAFALGAWLL